MSFCEDGERQRRRAGLSLHLSDFPHQPLDLCQCHKNVTCFLQHVHISVHVFLSCFCFSVYLHTSVHLSLIRRHLEEFQRLTQEGSTLFFFFRLFSNLDLERLEFDTSCRCFIVFCGCFSHKHFALFTQLVTFKPIVL